MKQLQGNLGLSPYKPKGIRQVLVVPQRGEEGTQKQRKQRENTMEPRELTSLTRIERLEKQAQEQEIAQREKEERKAERKRKRDKKEAENEEKKRRKIEQHQKEMPITQLLIQKGYMVEGGALTIALIDSFAKKNHLGRLGQSRPERVERLLEFLAQQQERVWLS